MIRRDRTFSEALTRAVVEAERGTSAELIVVVASRSGSYLDVALAAAGSAAMLVLVAALFAPTLFRPLAVAIEVPLVFAVAAWIAHRTPALVRALTPAKRLREHVERAAAARFIGESVHGTRARTGVLVYVSLLEERVAIVPDLGLDVCVPRTTWSDFRWSAAGDPSRPRTQADVVRGIGEIGAVLRAYLPAGPDDVNESPDAPRMHA